MFLLCESILELLPFCQDTLTPLASVVLNMLGPGSSAISCGLVEVGMFFLKEVHHCGVG